MGNLNFNWLPFILEGCIKEIVIKMNSFLKILVRKLINIIGLNIFLFFNLYSYSHSHLYENINNENGTTQNEAGVICYEDGSSNKKQMCRG